MYGRLAQLVEHLLDVQRVSGSSPLSSTTTSEQVSLVPTFLSKKAAHPLHCSSSFAKRPARFTCSLASALTTPFLRYHLFARHAPFGAGNFKFRLFRLFYSKKPLTRSTVPPLSQKGPLGSPVRLQARSRRLSFATTFSRDMRLSAREVSSFACSDFFIQKSRSPAISRFNERKQCRKNNLSANLFCKNTHNPTRITCIFAFKFIGKSALPNRCNFFLSPNRLCSSSFAKRPVFFAYEPSFQPQT